MKRHLVKTKDNSLTLFVPELDEHYHSIHGALQESQHVFIKAGLREFSAETSVNILEVGFGTALNALLTALELQNSGQEIFYHGLEKYPLTDEEWPQLEYASATGNSRAENIYKALHQAPWESSMEVIPRFILRKQKADLREVKLAEEEYHLIYFDAFAPSAQEDLWTEQVFEKMYRCLMPGGLLVTYCVKGSVRRNMKAAGFEVEKIPGPPGKREMARAWKR